MWNGPTIFMENNYPFGSVTDSSQKHLVKRKLNRGEGQMEKTKILSSLKHECLIKLEGLHWQDGEYYILYQYIHQSVEKWYVNVSREFIEHYEQRLIIFSRYLADKGIVVSFKRQNMGVSDSGDPKYYLNTNFVLDSNVDKLSLKKKYKEELRQLMQYYIDKKNAMKQPNTSKILPSDRKENNKVLKILQAIEKGRANLCNDPSKEQTVATMADSKPTLKSVKNIQNVFIQKEVNTINKIQVMVGNKPVQMLQQQFKREYASSSFYLNGIPTVKVQREGEARRLLSPNDKQTRFQEVKYKEYKSMKTSNEFYVQDFINVLEADDMDKNTLPGSPRATLTGSPRLTFQNPPQLSIQGGTKMTMPNSQPILPIEPQSKRDVRKFEGRLQDQKNLVSPKNTRVVQFNSEKQIRKGPKQQISIKNTTDSPQINKTSALQKKVSQAIANSLNAINKMKNVKNNQVNV